MKTIKEYVAYLKDNPNKYWFRRKLYGWGWTPATWQGWLVIIIFILAIVQLAFRLPTEPSVSEMIWFFAKLILNVAAVILICLVTGEKPRWQWGNDKKTNE